MLLDYRWLPLLFSCCQHSADDLLRLTCIRTSSAIVPVPGCCHAVACWTWHYLPFPIPRAPVYTRTATFLNLQLSAPLRRPARTSHDLPLCRDHLLRYDVLPFGHGTDAGAGLYTMGPSHLKTLHFIPLRGLTTYLVPWFEHTSKSNAPRHYTRLPDFACGAPAIRLSGLGYRHYATVLTVPPRAVRCRLVKHAPRTVKRHHRRTVDVSHLRITAPLLSRAGSMVCCGLRCSHSPHSHYRVDASPDKVGLTRLLLVLRFSPAYNAIRRENTLPVYCNHRRDIPQQRFFQFCWFCPRAGSYHLLPARRCKPIPASRIAGLRACGCGRCIALRKAVVVNGFWFILFPTRAFKVVPCNRTAWWARLATLQRQLVVRL